MTQDQLATASGMHRMAIAKIEGGTRGKKATWDSVQKLSAALGISADQLTTSMPTQAPAEAKTIAKAPRKPRRKKSKD